MRPRTLPALSALLLAAGLVLVVAGPARALEITLGTPHEQGGYVWVEVSLGDLFGPRVSGSLARGMPATLGLHAELWRHRTGWFDRLESSSDSPVRIRYDFRTDTYRLERTGLPAVEMATLDSVRVALSRPLALRVGRVAPLQSGRVYYVVVSATLKPLSVEDAAEVEGWLSGEVREGGGPPFGIITGLPRSLFDAVRNMAGFGDEHARASSPEFGLGSLFGGNTTPAREPGGR